MDEKMRIDHAGHVTTKPWPTQFDNDPSKWFELTGKIPKREWVGLTDEEKEAATGWSVEHIEAKLKEKNA
jgi:hypothetical protein